MGLGEAGLQESCNLRVVDKSGTRETASEAAMDTGTPHLIDSVILSLSYKMIFTQMNFVVLLDADVEGSDFYVRLEWLPTVGRVIFNQNGPVCTSSPCVII